MDTISVIHRLVLVRQHPQQNMALFLFNKHCDRHVNVLGFDVQLIRCKGQDIQDKGYCTIM